MANNENKVVINLATGLEDAERVIDRVPRRHGGRSTRASR